MSLTKKVNPVANMTFAIALITHHDYLTRYKPEWVVLRVTFGNV